MDYQDFKRKNALQQKCHYPIKMLKQHFAIFEILGTIFCTPIISIWLIFSQFKINKIMRIMFFDTRLCMYMYF